MAAGTDAGIGGVVYTRIGDQTVVVGARCQVDMAPVTRTEKTGMSGQTYFTEEPRGPTAEIEILTTPDTDLELLAAMVDSPVVISLRNGKIAAFENAFTTATLPVDAKEGTATLRIVGRSGEWIQ